MLKYLIIVFKLGFYLIYKTPKILYIYYRRNKYSAEYKYNYCRNIMHKLSKAFNVEYHIDGLENLPKDGQYVLYPNHQSNFDPLALISIFNEPFQFVGKIEVKKMPYINKFFEILDCIYLDREDIRASIKTMRECQRRIAEDKINYVIFPEGTRTRKLDRRMNEYKAGALKPAYGAHAYIVPTMLNGTYRVLNKNIRRKTYRVDIKFLIPISYEEYKDITTTDLAKQIHDLTAIELEKSFINNPAE